MPLNVHGPEDFDVVVVGTKETAWLKEALKADIEAGRIRYVDASGQPELAREIFGETADLTQPMAVVAAKGEQQGLTCAISAVGHSIIIHCEDRIIDLGSTVPSEATPK